MKNYLLKGFSAHSGISAAHVNAPNQSPVDAIKKKLPILLKYHGGLEFSVYKNTVVSPNVLVMTQGVDKQYNVGAYIGYILWNRYKNVSNNKARTAVQLGVWYRLEDSFIYSINIRNNNFNLGFSYDMNRSDLYRNAGNTGAYEISLAVKKYDPKRRKRKRFSSPLY
jgi:type IX secretion system PorP/SprF family membrane protein